MTTSLDCLMDILNTTPVITLEKEGNVTNLTLHEIDEEADYIPDAVIVIVMILLCLACLFGTLGNGLTLVAIATTKKLQTIPNIYVSNLAVSDVILCSILIPFTMIGVYTRSAPPGCQYHAYPVMVLLIVSMMTLAAISINRYVLVLKNSNTYMHIYTRLKVKLSVLLIWILSALANVVPFLGLGTLGYNRKFGACMIVASDIRTFIFVQGILHGMIFFPAMGITVFCYTYMARTFRKSQGKVAANMAKSYQTENHSRGWRASPTNCDDTVFTIDGLRSETKNRTLLPSTSQQCPASPDQSPTPTQRSCFQQLRSRVIEDVDSHQRRRDRMCLEKNRHSRTTYRVTFNLFLVWCAFAACWLPLIMTYTIDYEQRLPAALYHILMALAYCNSALNPILYAGLNKNFRTAFIRILTQGKR